MNSELVHYIYVGEKIANPYMGRADDCLGHTENKLEAKYEKEYNKWKIKGVCVV